MFKPRKWLSSWHIRTENFLLFHPWRLCCCWLGLPAHAPFDSVAQLSFQCSVSCGVGIQRRKQVCQRLTAKGRRVPLSEMMCRDLPGLPLVRSCQMPECSSKYAVSALHQDMLILFILSRCLYFPYVNRFLICG